MRACRYFQRKRTQFGAEGGKLKPEEASNDLAMPLPLAAVEAIGRKRGCINADLLGHDLDNGWIKLVQPFGISAVGLTKLEPQRETETALIVRAARQKRPFVRLQQPRTIIFEVSTRLRHVEYSRQLT